MVGGRGSSPGPRACHAGEAPSRTPGLPSATRPASSRTQRLRPGNATAGQGGRPSSPSRETCVPWKQDRDFVWPPSGLKLSPMPGRHAAGTEQRYAWMKQKHVYEPRKPTGAGACGRLLPGAAQAGPVCPNPAAPVPRPPRNRSSACPCRRPPSLQEHLVTVAPSCLQRALPSDLGDPGRKRSKQRLRPPAFLSSFICRPPTHPPTPHPTTWLTRGVSATTWTRPGQGLTASPRTAPPPPPQETLVRRGSSPQTPTQAQPSPTGGPPGPPTPWV